MGKLVKIFATERGASHIRENKPLQDAAYADAKNGLTLSIGYAVVADGHGSKKYFRSADGSQLAIKSAKDAINDALKETINNIIKEKDNAAVEKLLKHLCGSIILRWRENVTNHFAEHPLSDEEKQICEAEKLDAESEEQIPTFYGSTLIVAVYLQKLDFWFALQIGDGACFAIRQDGTIFSPIKEDERLGFGMTTSLCGKNAINDFHFSYGFEKINGMAVMTDGFSDSFTKEKLEQFISQDLYTNTIKNPTESERELKKFLPSLSERGSGDDVSIAAFFDTDGKKVEKKPIIGTTSPEAQQLEESIKESVNAAKERLESKIAKIIAGSVCFLLCVALAIFGGIKFRGFLEEKRSAKTAPVAVVTEDPKETAPVMPINETDAEQEIELQNAEDVAETSDADLFFSAIENNDIELAKNLISEGADINATVQIQMSPVMYAAIYDRTEIAEMLVNAGATVSQSTMRYAKSEAMSKILQPADTM